MSKNDDYLGSISKYYTAKVSEFGSTPQGVDWNGADGQNLRFQQLLKLLPAKINSNFSIGDLGCGYGALLEYLMYFYPNLFEYHGYDVSSLMIEKAKLNFLDIERTNFYVESQLRFPADYVVASGIFNVRLDANNKDWEDLIYSTIDNMYDNCVKGYAFNCLTKYSDREKMKDYLYYADPNLLFDYCKRKHSRNVALLHDYNLYEFTMIIRKSAE